MYVWCGVRFVLICKFLFENIGGHICKENYLIHIIGITYLKFQNELGVKETYVHESIYLQSNHNKLYSEVSTFQYNPK